MSAIFQGRFTAKTDQPFVVFLIGMRVNNLWAVHRWLPVAQAMVPMLRELYRHPEKGFLGATFAIAGGGPLVVQYWRSFDDLVRFAHNPDDPHLPSWKRFSQASKSGAAVGIWHETYLVEPGHYEGVYVNMPRFGLGQVMEHVPATGRLNSARERLKKAEETRADGWAV